MNHEEAYTAIRELLLKLETSWKFAAGSDLRAKVKQVVDEANEIHQKLEQKET